MRLLLGKYNHTIDPKGRLFVPAKLREELGDSFVISIGTDTNLHIHTEAGWQAILDKYNALPLSKSRDLRYFFANAVNCEPDKQGRILIPPALRDRVKIKQDVTIIGVGGHAEIWDTEIYNRMEAESLTPEKLLAAMEELDF